MNRHARRRAAAADRHRARRQAVAQNWARLLVDELVTASAGQEPNVEVGIVEGPNVVDLVPVYLPADFLRNLILARPLSVDGAQLPFVRAGVLDSGRGWAVQYEAMTFIIRGNFFDEIAEFKAAILGMDFQTITKAVKPAGKYCLMRRFMVEELECPGYPVSFLSPFHPDPAVDAALRAAEDAAIRTFWAMTDPYV